MTVIEWLDEKIATSKIHPDIKRHYLWVVEQYGKTKEENVITPMPTEKEFPCPECGAKKRLHRKECSHYKPIK